MACYFPLVDSRCGHETTSYQKPPFTALPTRRQVWKLYRHQGNREQALGEGSCRYLFCALRLWARNNAGQADVNQAFKRLRIVSLYGDRPVGCDKTSFAQALAPHDRPLHQSSKRRLQKLWSAGHKSFRALGDGCFRQDWFRGVSSGYGRLSAKAHYRAERQRCGIFARKLHMGDKNGANAQSPLITNAGMERKETARFNVGTRNWGSIFHTYAAVGIRLDGRKSANGGRPQTLALKAGEWPT